MSWRKAATTSSSVAISSVCVLLYFHVLSNSILRFVGALLLQHFVSLFHNVNQSDFLIIKHIINEIHVLSVRFVLSSGAVFNQVTQ